MRESFKNNVFWQQIEKGEPWPPDELISLMALAQHYGVPTRLLDWTRNPFIAAYFAAIGAHESAEKICVWALSGVYEEIQNILVGLPARKLFVVSAPASDNPNLQAQRWVGLLCRHVGVRPGRFLAEFEYDQLAGETSVSNLIFIN
jgi:hypothetical protein